MLEEFRRFLRTEEIEFKDTDFDENASFMERFIKQMVYNSAYDIEEGQRVFYELDPEVEMAIDALPRAKKLLEDGGQLLAASWQVQ